MKVQSKVFSKFLDKISVKEIEDVVLDFNAKGVFCKAVDLSNVLMVECSLDKEAFLDYEALGDIGIAGISRLNSIIKTFSDDLEITKKDNYIIMKGNRKTGKFILPNTAYIKEGRNFPPLEFAATFSIDKKVFLDSISNAGTLGSGKYVVKIAGSTLSIATGEQDQLTEMRELTGVDANVSLVINDTLNSLIKICEDQIEISMGSDIPMLIKDEQDKLIKARYILAPVIMGA